MFLARVTCKKRISNLHRSKTTKIFRLYNAPLAITGQMTHLLPATSISLMAMPIDGSINRVVRPLMRIDAEVELRPKFDKRTATPACSRIWGV